MLENAVLVYSSGISPVYLAVMIAEQCPICWRARQDSSRVTPISDCSRDGTHAFRFVEARGPSKLDARIHAAHWFHVMENLVSSGIQGRSDFGSLSRSASALRAPPCLENPREERSDKPPHSCTVRFCKSADRLIHPRLGLNSKAQRISGRSDCRCGLEE